VPLPRFLRRPTPPDDPMLESERQRFWREFGGSPITFAAVLAVAAAVVLAVVRIAWFRLAVLVALALCAGWSWRRTLPRSL
jgi:tetrahydromethanopterin S-methyltransferase subunit E